jgi:hypothetical protein
MAATSSEELKATTRNSAVHDGMIRGPTSQRTSLLAYTDTSKVKERALKLSLDPPVLVWIDSTRGPLPHLRSMKAQVSQKGTGGVGGATHPAPLAHSKLLPATRKGQAKIKGLGSEMPRCAQQHA